jgi:hypothetical protein
MKTKLTPEQRDAARRSWRAEGKARRAHKAEIATRTAEPVGRPAMPNLDLLTIADRQRVTRAMGLDMPMPEGAFGPQPDAMQSKQLADRFVSDLGRHHDREARKRGEALRPGSFQGTAASPDDVRARVEQLGLDPLQMPHLAPVGRPLDPPKHINAATQTHSQADADMQVARGVHRAMQLGQRVDAKKLTAGEVRALLQLRGATY